jgi:predicted TIM-barrel fold metal-dependent hydrolase
MKVSFLFYLFILTLTIYCFNDIIIQNYILTKEGTKMLFDTHVHIFPEKLKGKVLPKLGEISGTPYYSDGTLEFTLEAMKKSGCTHALTLHIATNPKQQKNVNDFAISSQQGNIYAFGSVHPDSPDAVDELYRINAAGLKGVKFHPDYQGFFVDDEKMDAIYRTCQELGLITVFHTGRDPVSPEIVHCSPAALANVALRYPEMKIIAAHMGGMEMPDEAAKYLCDKDNVYFDTAFATRTLDRNSMKALIGKKGTDRVLFATDFPWSTVSTEKELIDSLGLTEEDKEKIYWKNAFKLLKIENDCH